jgi:hypothetical protein
MDKKARIKVWQVRTYKKLDRINEVVMINRTTYTDHLNRYDRIWEETPGEAFDKILELFRRYCGLDKSFGLHGFRNTHNAEVTAVISPYYYGKYGDDAYLKKYRDTPVCNPGFLLLEITSNISVKNISQDGGLAAIFEVIQKHTGINVYAFYKGNKSRCKIRPSVFTLSLYSTFAEFMIRFFPSVLNAKFDNSYVHPINHQSIKLVIEDKLDFESLTQTYMSNIEGRDDPVSVMLRFDPPINDKKFTPLLTPLFHYKIKKLDCKDYKTLLQWFELALEKNNYVLAKDFVCQAHNPGLDTSFDNNHIKNINDIIDELFVYLDAHRLKALYPFFIKIILFDGTSGALSANSIYKLYSLRNRINDFLILERYLIQKHKIDYNIILCSAINMEDKYNLIEYFLKEKNIDSRKTNISYRLNYHNRESLEPEFVFDKNDCVNFSLVQYLLKRASMNIDDNLTLLFNNLLKLINHDPGCVSQPDSMGNSIFYYFRMLARKRKSENDQTIIKNIKNIFIDYSINKILLLANNQQNILSRLPKELIYKISAITRELLQPDQSGRDHFKILTNYLEQRGDSDNKNNPRPVVSLNHDQAVELYEMALKRNSPKLALYVLCLTGQINEAEINNYPFHKWDELLFDIEKFCKFIHQPIPAIYFLKLLDYYKYYKKYSSCQLDGRSYPALIKIKNHISDWECVNNKFIKFFNPSIADALWYASDNQTTAYLLKAKNQEIRQKKQGVTPIQAIIMEAINDEDKCLLNYGFPLKAIILNICKYKRQLLEECDQQGHDIYFYLDQLAAVTREKELKSRVAKIIKLVKEEISREVCFRKTGLLFFDRSSPIYTELPSEVVEQIARFTVRS